MKNSYQCSTYIDDIFVLTEVIKYPESGLITSIQSLRPILIVSLLLMSIELVFRPLTAD